MFKKHAPRRITRKGREAPPQYGTVRIDHFFARLSPAADATSGSASALQAAAQLDAASTRVTPEKGSLASDGSAPKRKLEAGLVHGVERNVKACATVAPSEVYQDGYDSGTEIARAQTPVIEYAEDDGGSLERVEHDEEEEEQLERRVAAASSLALNGELFTAVAKIVEQPQGPRATATAGINNCLVPSAHMPQTTSHAVPVAAVHHHAARLLESWAEQRVVEGLSDLQKRRRRRMAAAAAGQTEPNLAPAKQLSFRTQVGQIGELFRLLRRDAATRLLAGKGVHPHVDDEMADEVLGPVKARLDFQTASMTSPRTEVFELTNAVDFDNMRDVAVTINVTLAHRLSNGGKPRASRDTSAFDSRITAHSPRFVAGVLAGIVMGMLFDAISLALQQTLAGEGVDIGPVQPGIVTHAQGLIVRTLVLDMPLTGPQKGLFLELLQYPFNHFMPNARGDVCKSIAMRRLPVRSENGNDAPGNAGLDIELVMGINDNPLFLGPRDDPFNHTAAERPGTATFTAYGFFMENATISFNIPGGDAVFERIFAVHVSGLIKHINVISDSTAMELRRDFEFSSKHGLHSTVRKLMENNMDRE